MKKILKWILEHIYIRTKDLQAKPDDMSPDEIAPTLVAMDMQKLYVGDNGGLRRLTLREGLRLCGYPDTIRFNVSEKDGFDLLGNTVVVPVIKAVASRLLDCII